MHQKIRKLCQKQRNLVWLTDADTIALNPEVALIGAEGWYSANLGKPEYLRCTVDWFLTKDFRILPDMDARIAMFRDLATQSCDILADKLETALAQGFKRVYLLTHVPPWKEAIGDEGTWLQNYNLPYNVNLCLGQRIEEIMSRHKDQEVTVLAGHTHADCWVHVASNIECKVNRAKYYDFIRNEERIFI